MTRITRMLLCWIGLSSLAAAGETAALFNGKNLDGWTFDVIDPEVTPEQIWSVADGILVCKGRPPGVIRTEKDYENYQITVEWRWPQGGKPGNSGLLVHCSIPRDRFVWPKSIEVQLSHENAGDFWMIGEKVTVPNATPQDRRWIKRQNSVEKPVGQWNTMRVRCEGNRIKVWVNDVLMNEGTDITATKGAICLQSEGAEVHFRKVELTPIR